MPGPRHKASARQRTRPKEAAPRPLGWTGDERTARKSRRLVETSTFRVAYAVFHKGPPRRLLRLRQASAQSFEPREHVWEQRALQYRFAAGCSTGLVAQNEKDVFVLLLLARRPFS